MKTSSPLILYNEEVERPTNLTPCPLIKSSVLHLRAAASSTAARTARCRNASRGTRRAEADLVQQVAGQRPPPNQPDQILVQSRDARPRRRMVLIGAAARDRRRRVDMVHAWPMAMLDQQRVHSAGG
jgi:hypothetical protein